jgi:hypothetical protein
LKELDFAAGVKFLTMALDQLRLVVESIDLAGCPRHEQLNDTLGPSSVVQSVPGFFGQESIFAEQVRQGDPAQPAARMPEEASSIQEIWLRFRSIDEDEFIGIE